MIRSHVTRMATEVCGMVDHSLQALVTGDRALASKTILDDRVINRLEIDTDELCLSVLARRQPVASDLRVIATALKLDTDLAYGYLCWICERLLQAPPRRTRYRCAPGRWTPPDEIETALRAFVTGNVTLAQAVLESDDALDRAYWRTRREPSSRGWSVMLG